MQNFFSYCYFLATRKHSLTSLYYMPLFVYPQTHLLYIYIQEKNPTPIFYGSGLVPAVAQPCLAIRC